MTEQAEAAKLQDDFEPVIIAYCCKWCSYAAADLAGNMRIQYPANIRIIVVPCTGRLDTLHIIKTFEYGADGVFISGCLPGDCHYMTGNYKAQKKVTYIKGLLSEIKLEPERLEMYHNSAAMGPQFAKTCIDFTARIKELGPCR
ncbi:MAG: hydrogenase iron-sulfur subunit [Deltaproteobacteria bacterium]|nr:hydrogenase iron-sulfur subunit [Deltaproteobacteria bacterium]